MPIKIQRYNDLWTAEVTPQDVRKPHWHMSGPVSANELVKQLRDLGCHTTDIGDAFFAACPDWVKDATA